VDVDFDIITKLHPKNIRFRSAATQFRIVVIICLHHNSAEAITVLMISHSTFWAYAHETLLS
jgi:hypothetical protein